MAFDAFVKIDGIEAESRDEGHSGWIEVTRFAFALRQKISGSASSAGGASAERADFREFIFKKELDHASPQLALACAAGTHIDEIRVEIFRAGGEKVKFMEYKLQNLMRHPLVKWRTGDVWRICFQEQRVRNQNE